MSETPSLSPDERAELERLRSEVATLRSQVQAGGQRRPVRGRPSGAAAVAGHRGHPVHLGWPPCHPLDWPKGSIWLLERASQRHIHTHYLAPLALGGRAESVNGPCPLPDGGIVDLA
jgi:hypothetical protein